MSERIEELLAKMIQLQEETVKELRINNRMLAFMHIYGIKGNKIASFDSEELEFVGSIMKRKA